MDHLYAIEVSCAGLGARVSFNGCTAFKTWSADERGIRQNLAPWLVPGDNRIEVHLRTVPTEEDQERSFAFCLRRIANVPDAGDGLWMVSYLWTENESPVDVNERCVLAYDFKALEALGRWEWQRARPYEEHRDRTDVEELIVRVHKALQDRDAPTLNALLGIKLAELGHALDIPLEQMQLDQAKYFEMYFDDPQWTVLPLDIKALTLEPDADGRLVHVLGQDGAPPLIGVGGGRPFAFPLTVSNIDDSWLIVR